METKINRIIFLIILVTFFKGLVWAAVVPIWHTPDEQAHFAEIEFMAEKRRLPTHILNPQRVEKDLSREILMAEQLLGTERDEAGINKFTYHPEYNLPYENGQIGKYEREINNFPQSWRGEMVKNEATNYPPLYYLSGSIPYLLFYSSDLFTRVFVVRVLSVLLIVLTVYFSFKIGREIFSDDFLMQISIPILVSFQPMFTFVGSGANSDNLINLLFTIFIYQGLRVIKKGFSPSTSGMMGIIIGLGLLTKPQFFIPIPIALSLFFWETRKKQWGTLFKNFLLFTLSFLAFGGWWVIRLSFLTGNPTTVNLGGFNNSLATFSIFEYVKTAFIRTIRETLPWYWGVFKWLGLTLPRLANQILMRITLLAAVGLLWGGIRMLKNKKFGHIEKSMIFLLLVNLVYIGSIYLFDFYFIRSHGFSIGMQGRYFLPLISTQMIFLSWGIINLFPKKWLNLRKIVIILLCLGMVVLNFVALTTVFRAYYQANDPGQAINWLSQYKPWFVKGAWFVSLLGFYLLSLGWFVKNYVQNSLRQSTNKP